MVLAGSSRCVSNAHFRHFVRSKGTLPVLRPFTSDNATDHTELGRIFHALPRDRQIGAIDERAVLVAEHLIPSTFLSIVLDDSRALFGGALAIGYDGVTTGVLVTKLGDVPGEILMRFSGAHENRSSGS